MFECPRAIYTHELLNKHTHTPSAPTATAAAELGTSAGTIAEHGGESKCVAGRSSRTARKGSQCRTRFGERFKDETRRSHFELENKFNMLSVVQDTMVTEMRHNYDHLKLMMDEQHRDSSHTEGPEGAADDWVDYVEVDRRECGRSPLPPDPTRTSLWRY